MTKPFDPLSASTNWQMDYARLPELGYELDDYAGKVSPLQRAVDFLCVRKALRARYAALMPEGHTDRATVTNGAPCAYAAAGCSGHIAPNARSGILRCDECWQES